MNEEESNPFLGESSPEPPDLQKSRRSSRTAGTPDLSRLPPSAVEAECGILGCILLSPVDCLPECITKLKAGPEVFYDIRNQSLYQALVEMYDEHVGIDTITLRQYLSDIGKLDECGGLAYIAKLPDAVPSAAGLDYYVDIVLSKYRLRKIIQTCTSIVGRIYENDGDEESLLGEAETDLINLRKDSNAAPALMVKELVQNAITTLSDAAEHPGLVTGIKTGFPDLDKLLGGLRPPQVFVVGARPSQGKSSWMMQVADYTSVELKIPTGIFSLEMSADQLMTKALCTRARVDLRQAQEGYFTDGDFPKLTSAAGKLAHAPLYVDDTGGLTTLALRARARQMVANNGVKIIFIDYLQMLASANKYLRSREEKTADVSDHIKGMAKELNVIVVILAALNREVEKRTNGVPQLSDLRESGKIESDADVVGLLYKEKQEEGAEVPTGFLPMILAIDKNRMGPTGQVSLTFARAITRFESVARVSKDDVPTQYEAGQRVENE